MKITGFVTRTSVFSTGDVCSYLQHLAMNTGVCQAGPCRIRCTRDRCWYRTKRFFHWFQNCLLLVLAASLGWTAGQQPGNVCANVGNGAVANGESVKRAFTCLQHHFCYTCWSTHKKFDTRVEQSLVSNLWIVISKTQPHCQVPQVATVMSPAPDL